MGSTLGPLLLGVIYTLLVLSTVFMALRFYCRASIVKMIGSDDWIMLVALINAWGLGVTNTFHVKYGIGTHAADIKDYAAIIIPTLKLWYVYQLQYLLTLFFIKASILSFYRRISPKRSYQISVWIVSGIVVAYTVAMLFIFECPKDPSRAWAPDFPKGCDNVVDVHYSMMAPFNILSDIVILLLPLPSLLRLQINKRKRAVLLLIFSCGFIAVAASIGRLNALYKHRHALIAGGDAPYMATYILLWSQIEVNVGIITASAPALGPLVRSILRGTSYAKSCYTGTGQKSKHGIPLHSLGGRETNRPHGNTTTVEGGANESQEDIVSKNDGIIRTVEVKVDVEANGRSEDSIRQLEFGR